MFDCACSSPLSTLFTATYTCFHKMVKYIFDENDGAAVAAAAATAAAAAAAAADDDDMTMVMIMKYL